MTQHQHNSRCPGFTRSLRAWLGIGVGLGIVCVPMPSLAQGQWIMLDRHLDEHVVELSMLSGDTLLATDEMGISQRYPITTILLMTHQHDNADKPPRDPPWMTRQLVMFGEDPHTPVVEPTFDQILELVDGQRWTGSPIFQDNDTLSWTLFDAMTQRVSLESIKAIHLAPMDDFVVDTWLGVDDRVVLRNNDIIDGYVESINDSVSIESDQDTVSIPVARVAAVLLANPQVDPHGMRILTTNNSIIEVASLELSPTGRVRIIPSKNRLLHTTASTYSTENASATGEIERERSDIEQILFDAGQVSGLAQLDIAQITHPSQQVWQREPQREKAAPFGFGDIALTGPIEVRWTLPRWAERFATTVALPPANWAWGDCQLVVLDEPDHELIRVHINADNPRVRINIPLSGSNSITIRIESGVSGPIQDNLVLQSPIILWK